MEAAGFRGDGISCIMVIWIFYFLVGIFSILKILLILSKNPSLGTTAPSRAAAPVFLKMRDRTPARKKNSVEVDIHCSPPFREINRFQRSHRAIDASVQDQGVDIAEGLNGFAK